MLKTAFYSWECISEAISWRVSCRWEGMGAVAARRLCQADFGAVAGAALRQPGGGAPLARAVLALAAFSATPVSARFPLPSFPQKATALTAGP